MNIPHDADFETWALFVSLSAWEREIRAAKKRLGVLGAWIERRHVARNALKIKPGHIGLDGEIVSSVNVSFADGEVNVYIKKTKPPVYRLNEVRKALSSLRRVDAANDPHGWQMMGPINPGSFSYSNQRGVVIAVV